MFMDKMTEMVAHMIGIFHTTVEDERMRDAYDKFKALSANDPELNDFEIANLPFDTKYNLTDFTPVLGYKPPPPDSPDGMPGAMKSYGPYFPSETLSPFFAGIANTTRFDFKPWGGAGAPVLTLEPASSVVVITYQTAILFDNDIFQPADSEMIFIDPSVYLEELLAGEAIATAITAPLVVNMIPLGDESAQSAVALADHVQRAETTTFAGVSATLILGSDTLGVHINGATADEIPVLDDLMPAFKQPDDDGSEEAAAGAGNDDTTEIDGVETADVEHEFPDPFEGLGYGSNDMENLDDGHAVVTGANLLVNEVVISTAWLDAPVISVMGDVVNLDVIVQFNMLMDHDNVSLGKIAGSVTMNVAGIEYTSSAPDPGDETESVQVSMPTLPSNWVVTKIEGDVLCVNQVTQYTFQTDNDVAEISFGSTNTYIGMGDNTVINLTDLAELGYGYDLIIVGGAMISVNWITQTNILIDNDMLTYSGLSPTGMDGGDNLLFNGAFINGTGIDSYTQMQDNFANATNALGSGGTSIGSDVAKDPIFEGVDILKVLYIEGNFTTLNWIDQTNVLGDSDQVHLAMENLESATGVQAQVTAGSNALINAATITEYGVDSTILVGGDVYDDALLYQAELIDTDADPLGVNMPALATEAVAFLADDMLTPDTGDMDVAIIATSSESTASSDVMQTMLA